MKKLLLLFVIGTLLGGCGRGMEGPLDRNGNGIAAAYDQNGSKSMEGYYKNGKKHGLWIFYKQDGTIDFFRVYAKGIEVE
jgi:antitoxin component YwqK of YwqJK toxin-antitoxin module